MSPKQKRVKQKRKTGLPPGSLVYTGNLGEATNSFILYAYNEDSFEVYNSSSIDTIFEKLAAQEDKKCWLKVTGLSQTKGIHKLGKKFKISSLVLEDILDVSQRPKCSIFKDYLFFSLKTIDRNQADLEDVKYEQISMVLKENLVISFHEREDNWFENLAARLESNETLLRTKSIDYLFYRLIDTVVDYYYIEVDNFEDRIEELEVNINKSPRKANLQSIQQLKRDLITLRKNVYPLREAISLVAKGDNFLSESVSHHLFSVYEHTIHIIETIETYKDLISGLMDLYMMSTSNRMNEIMKVLTIISTIFIPLTFIVGVYGMNFKYMPELEYKWGYPASMLLMAIIAVGMIFYFRKKKWM